MISPRQVFLSANSPLSFLTHLSPITSQSSAFICFAILNTSFLLSSLLIMLLNLSSSAVFFAAQTTFFEYLLACK